jgi:prepilin-type N-terminal cleavage/methylation domain-containing protein
MQRAFTLIEILIVIAIVGVLAAVVLGSLSDARVSGAEAKLKMEMDALSKEAAQREATSFTYDIVCGSNGVSQEPSIATILTALAASASSSLVCNSTTGSYAVSVPLGLEHWCVDSTGSKRLIPAPLTSSPLQTVCP